jgi:hypothetical protein
MTTLRPEDHERFAMELVTFAKDELQRRKKAPILIPREDIDAQLKEARFPVHMVDPKNRLESENISLLEAQI